MSEPGAAIDGLRDTWSRYVSDWHATARTSARTLGEEVGRPGVARDLVVEELAGPYLGSSVDVLELGCGGGKFSLRLAARSGSLVCSDISAEMIDQTRADADGQRARRERRVSPV